MQRRYITAREAGIDHLYHFAAFDMARLYPIVAFNRLYFARPQGFGDAWDCRPSFDISRIDDPHWREETAQWLERLYDHGLAELSPHARERFRTLLRENGEILRRMVTEANAMADWINDVFRIFCFSTHADHPLNWAHYGRGHTGICLEFETSTVFFAEAAQVAYADEYPAMPLKIKQEEDALLPILTKPNHWSHEAEYRLIAQERGRKLSHQTLIADDHWVRFPSQSLKSIIVGCMMGRTERETLKSLIKHSPTPIELKKAIKIPGKFALQIVPFC